MQLAICWERPTLQITMLRFAPCASERPVQSSTTVSLNPTLMPSWIIVTKMFESLPQMIDVIMSNLLKSMILQKCHDLFQNSISISVDDEFVLSQGSKSQWLKVRAAVLGYCQCCQHQSEILSMCIFQKRKSFWFTKNRVFAKLWQKLQKCLD